MADMFERTSLLLGSDGIGRLKKAKVALSASAASVALRQRRLRARVSERLTFLIRIRFRRAI